MRRQLERVRHERVGQFVRRVGDDRLDAGRGVALHQEVDAARAVGTIPVDQIGGMTRGPRSALIGRDPRSSAGLAAPAAQRISDSTARPSNESGGRRDCGDRRLLRASGDALDGNSAKGMNVNADGRHRLLQSVAAALERGRLAEKTKTGIAWPTAVPVFVCGIWFMRRPPCCAAASHRRHAVHGRVPTRSSPAQASNDDLGSVGPVAGTRVQDPPANARDS